MYRFSRSSSASASRDRNRSRIPAVASRRGFTLIELLVVIAVVVALAGLSIPVYSTFRERAKANASTALVQAVAAAIDGYQQQSWTWESSPGQRMTRPLWDLNGDGLLDGDPARENAVGTGPAFSAQILASGYRGCLDMTRPVVGQRFVDPQRRIIDAWGTPLGVAYAPRAFGGSHYGVSSAGPDRGHGTDDDITSWEYSE